MAKLLTQALLFCRQPRSFKNGLKTPLHVRFSARRNFFVKSDTEASCFSYAGVYKLGYERGDEIDE